jgi:hypothetical protein
MSLNPKKKEPETKSELINENMKLSKREYKIHMLREKKKFSMINEFEKGQLAVLESGLDE